MLNGQLLLTDTLAAVVRQTRLRRPLFIASACALAALAGCAGNNHAPVTDLSNQPASTAHAAGGTYVVKPGDTLYKIARANGVDIETLKRQNNITDPNQISVGRVLQLSGSGAAVATSPAQTSTVLASSSPQARPLDQPDSAATAATAAPPAVDTTTTATPAAAAPAAAAPAAVAPVAPVSKTARAADAGLIDWNWPASGQVTQTFNSNSKGIDIVAAIGDPVTAAADGKVVYSGNGVRGLGNLIIINHAGGFITAYAHNKTLLAKTGQEVKRGAKIAELGQSDVPSPRLHFEIRRQGTPVDPLQYLPAK